MAKVEAGDKQVKGDGTLEIYRQGLIRLTFEGGVVTGFLLKVIGI